jgi:hypothetical protein
VRPHNIEVYNKEYFWEKYTTFVAKSDMYSCFMEKGINLVREKGLFSFIVTHTWTSLESFTSIRDYILKNCAIQQLVQLPKKVFTEATVETCIFVFRREKTNADTLIDIYKIDSNKEVSFIRKFSQNEIDNAHLHNFQLYGRESGQKIIDKIKIAGQPLENYVKLVYGFKTGDDNKFISNKKLNKKYKLFIRSADIYRYGFNSHVEYVLYAPEIITKNRRTARPGELKRFLSEKIIVARMGKDVIASYDAGGLFIKDAMLLLNIGNLSLKYIIGILNSKLMNYYYHEYFITIDVLKNALLSLPITMGDEGRCNKLNTFVDQMLVLKKREHSATVPHTKTMLGRQIAALDKQIDETVYALYGLTEDEIKIVEGNEA